MTKDKTTLPQAQEIAEKLKKKYNFGKPSCPEWFKNTCTPMEQDGSFGVSICIPSWKSISQDEQNVFFELFEGIHITLRIVTAPKPYNYGKKKKEAIYIPDDKENKNDKT